MPSTHRASNRLNGGMRLVPVWKDPNTNLVGNFTEPIEPIRVRDSRSNPTARLVIFGREVLRASLTKQATPFLNLHLLAYATHGLLTMRQQSINGEMTLVPVWKHPEF